MPAAREPAEFIGSSSTGRSHTNNYFSYDQPPGPDRYYPKAEAFLPSRRRSWTDVVDQCSEQNTERISTITDVSSLADSRTSVPAAQTDFLSVNNNGTRRRSWEQLIEESDENFKTDYASGADFAKSITAPLPTLPLPYANPALHLMTVRDDGRLARVHLYNKKRSSTDSNSRTITDQGGIGMKTETNRKESSSGSSKTSTMSEFILVPFKTALTSSTSSDDDGSSCSRRFRHDFGKSTKRTALGIPCPWTLSRRTTFVMILTAALLLTTALGGYVLRRFIIGRRTRYELTFPTSDEYKNGAPSSTDRSPTTLRLLVNEPSTAEFSLIGAWPYQDVRTVVDFGKKLVITRHLNEFSNYCFISHLNESAFPTIDSLKEAAVNALPKTRSLLWPEDWRWQPELVNENLRDTLYFDAESRSKCDKNLYWLRKMDTFAAKCVGCYSVCLPSYGVTRLDLDGGRPLLAPSGRDCFWLPSASTATAAADQISTISRPFVNNWNNNGPSYFNVGPVFNQQQQPLRPVDTVGFRPYQQNGLYAYANQQPYQNTYNSNPTWTNFGPSGFVRRA